MTSFLAESVEAVNVYSPLNTSEQLSLFSDGFDVVLQRTVDHVKGIPGLKAVEEPPHVQQAILQAQKAAVREWGIGEDEEQDWEDRLDNTAVRRVFTKWPDQKEVLPEEEKAFERLFVLFEGQSSKDVIYVIATFIAVQLHVSGSTSPEAIQHVSEQFSSLLQLGSQHWKLVFKTNPHWRQAGRERAAKFRTPRERLLARVRRGLHWVSRRTS